MRGGTPRGNSDAIQQILSFWLDKLIIAFIVACVFFIEPGSIVIN